VSGTFDGKKEKNAEPRAAVRKKRLRTGTRDSPPLEFSSRRELEDWLDGNHSTSNGIWVRMYKRKSGVLSVNRDEALEAVLCYGWITGQARPYDDVSWLARYVPRRPRSIWSRINVGIAERLISEGRMKPPRLKQVAEAKKDGRWERAYLPPSTATFPPDFLSAVEENEKAKEFLGKLSKANGYAIIFRIVNSKDEKKRRAKISSLVEMLERGETFH
jgi:uncharacterized protein YdeI (YjbR/CyaY-like superfamily)